MRLQAAGLERFLHQRAVGEREVVGDDGVLGESLQGQRLLEQGVLGRHDDDAVPLVDRQRDQFRVERNHLGGDAHVGLAGDDLLADLSGVSLVQEKLHLRVTAFERRDCLRQCVSRLSVSGRYR